MKRTGPKSFFTLTLATLLASVVVYAFQLASSWIGILYGMAKNEFDIPDVYIFVVIFSLGVVEFLILYLTRINRLSLRSMQFLAREGIRPRFVLAIATVFVTSLISMLMGLALGSEAPSMYLSGASFCMVYYLAFKKDGRDGERIREAISTGSGVGFSMAFQNPLAGLLMGFVGKDIRKVGWRECLSSLYANILGWIIFGLLRMAYYPISYGTTWFDSFEYIGYANRQWSMLSTDGYMALLLIPGLCLICAFVFVALVGICRKFVTRDHILSYMLSLILATTACGLIFVFRDTSALGSGMSIVLSRSSKVVLSDVMLLILIRLCLTIISFDGHFFGGMVIPTISVGCLLGEAFSSILLWSNSSYVTYEDLDILIVIFMICFYACVSAKPIVALALSFSFLPMHIVALPMFLCLIPIALVIYTSKYKGLSNMLYDIDNHDGVSYYHRRHHIRNFIRM